MLNFNSTRHKQYRTLISNSALILFGCEIGETLSPSQIVSARESLMWSGVWRRDREERERERKRVRARINRFVAFVLCVPLYSRDPIITDRRETITSRRAVPRSYCAPPSAIFYFCSSNTNARANIFQPWSSSHSRVVYRGFLTREIHRNLPPESFPPEFRLILAHPRNSA